MSHAAGVDAPGDEDGRRPAGYRENSPDTVPPDAAGPAASATLGVAVYTDQILSAVVDGDGGVLASNIVDLPDRSPQAAETAVEDLIASVPYDIERVGVACAGGVNQRYLVSAFAHQPGRPDWYRSVTVTDLPAALAQVAMMTDPNGGVAAVVDLDRAAAPAVGMSVVTVDTPTGEVLGVSEYGDGSQAPVTDAVGASALAQAVAALSGGNRVARVICTGPGAEIPGVAPAFEYAVQRPVSIAERPGLASAIGAAFAADAAGNAATASGGGGSVRWWLLGATIAVALLLAAASLIALATGGFGNQPAAETTTPAGVSTTTVTERPPPVTVTGVGSGDAETVTETTTVTPPRSTVTRTTSVRPPAETQTETETVTETTTVTVNPGPPVSGFPPQFPG